VRLILEELVGIGWVAVGAGGAEVDVGSDVGEFVDEAEDDVGSVA